MKNNVIKIVSPIDGAVVAERKLATEDEINAALLLAVEAQVQWKATAIAERAKLCRKAIDYMVESGMNEDMALNLYHRSMLIPAQLTSYDVGGEEIKALRSVSLKVGDVPDNLALSWLSLTRYFWISIPKIFHFGW